MEKLRLILPAAAMTAWLGFGVAPVMARAGDITIMFGRGQIQQTTGSCAPAAGSVDLWTIARELKDRGLTATLPVTASQITGTCHAGALYPSWADLATFRDTYGWSVVPRGLTNDSLKDVTDPVTLDANVCGSRDVLESHGFKRAWGMFAWPQNRWTLTQEATYVPKCFAFGRKYASQTHSNRLPVTGPYWWAQTISVNGGRCADVTLPCHTMQVRNDRAYMQPTVLAATGRKAYGDYWTIFQWYRLVTGKFGQRGDATAWDCTASNPAEHWTSYAEIYCYADYEAVLDGIDLSRVTVTDPAGVAAQQGLLPARPVH